MNDEELLEYNAEIFRKFAEIVKMINLHSIEERPAPYDLAKENDDE